MTTNDLQATSTTAGHDFLALARDAFTSSTTFFDASIRSGVEANLRQFQGVHPQGSKYYTDVYRARSRLFRPKTRTSVRKNEAVASEAFFSTNDVVDISAEDEDNPIQRASAAVKNSLLNYRLRKSIPWFQILIGAYQDCQVSNVCISYQYWMYNAKKGIDKPCIDLRPVENIRIDPGADWADPINSSPYVIDMIPMRVMDVKSRMKNPDPTTGQPRWFPLDEGAIMAAQQSYSDTTRQTRERNRTDSKDQSNQINEFAIVWVHRVIMEIDGEDMVYYTLGTHALLSNPIPIKQAYWHGKRPYVMGTCVIETHKIYPDGPVAISKDVQAEINEVTNQRIDNVKFAMNKRYFVRRNQQVDIRSLVRNVPSSVTMMNNPKEDVMVQETQDVTASAYQEQDRLNLDFDDVTGSFSQASVNSNRKLNETVGGLKLLTNDANQMGAYQLKTFVETWVEPVLTQLLLLEQHYETDELALQLASKEAAKLMELASGQMVGQELMDELLDAEVTLTVNVGIGATNPQDKINSFMKSMANLRELLADGVLEKYNLDVSEVIKELFGKLGYKNGSRFFKSEDGLTPMENSMRATIQELQAKLSQKVDPALVDAQVRKLDAEVEKLGAQIPAEIAKTFKTNMEAFFATLQGAQMLATVPQLAPSADRLAQASGYQNPNPAGVDPNLVAPGAPLPELTQNAVKDPRTGIEFTPGGAVAGDTTPMTPISPQSAAEGANQGIETARAD